MLASKAPLLLFLLLLGPAVQSTSDVLELRGFGALQEAAKDYKLLAVEFYAPWCRHCKRLEPEWAKAATELKSQHADAGIKLARIDATDDFNSDVVAKFGIKGYPTINTILHGDVDHPQDYGGPRDAPGITAYLLKQLAPAEKKLGPGNTTDELAQVLEEAEVAVVAFLPSEEGAEHVAFKAMAERLKFGEHVCLY